MAAEHREQGNAHFRAGDFTAAAAEYTAALRLDPRDAALWNNRAHALLQCGRPHLAAADCMCCLQLDPTYLKAHYRLGAALLAMGGTKSAIDAIKAGMGQCSGPAQSEFKKLLKQAKEKQARREVKPDPKYDTWYRPVPRTIPLSTYTVEQNRDFFQQIVKTIGAETDIEVRDLDPALYGGGRGLFALHDFKKGDVVFVDEPVCTVSFAPDLCCRCGSHVNETALVICPTCQAEAYCSETCRTLARDSYHASQCGDVAARVGRYRHQCWELGLPLESGYAPLMAVKIAGMTQNSQGNPQDTFDVAPFKHMVRLLDEPDPALAAELSFPFENRYAQFMMIQQMLGNPFDPRFDFAWYDELWNLMVVNVIGGEGSLTASVMGVGTFINHSCDPNCHPNLGEGHTVTFKACRDIAAGEQLFSFYTDPSRPLEERRARLEEQYLFVCRCLRCMAESPSQP
eukprot:GGOE01061903.1.p1 GENE.GGOE01061903.1~~GGOE01061903.1.p1  ORF type:complete len:456 (+),score=94.56 GGOE01061903.1:55-1422(+)